MAPKEMKPKVTTSSISLRWFGLALLLGGILILPSILHPDEADPNALIDPLWAPVHIIVGVGFILSLFGLFALYMKQADKAGALGAFAFCMVFVATAFLGGTILSAEGFIFPAIAQSAAAQTLLDPTGPILGSPLGALFAVSIYVLGASLLLLGITIWRAGVLPRYAGVLLIVGAPLAVLTPPLPHILGNIGGTLIGLGYIWLGYVLWRGE